MKVETEAQLDQVLLAISEEHRNGKHPRDCIEATEEVVASRNAVTMFKLALLMDSPQILLQFASHLYLAGLRIGQARGMEEMLGVGRGEDANSI